MTELQEDKKLTLETEITAELNSENCNKNIDNTASDNVENPEQTNAPNLISIEGNAIESTNIPEPNCLALTVRKDYNLVIVKNIFTASGRLSWKVALATIILNFLNMIF